MPEDLKDLKQQSAETAKLTPDGPSDLSSEIATEIERRPGDIVRCTRVGIDGYRCNWWSAQNATGYDNPRMSGLLVTTHRVRQSQFLRVSRAKTGKLVIKVVTAAGTSRNNLSDN
jgi:hypothetical protein